MASLVRSATLSLSSRCRDSYYQVLEKGCNNSSRRATKECRPPMFKPSLDGHVLNRRSQRYKLERVKKRQIFLQSYKLSFQTPVEVEQPLSVKLKKSFRKVKSAVLSMLRWKTFRTCRTSGPPTLCVSSPTPLACVVPLSPFR